MKISYSSYQESSACLRKYYHRKILKTPVDSNYAESNALGYGKAYHKSLELCLHSFDLFAPDMFRAAVAEFGQEENAHGIFACLAAYFKQPARQAIACEYELQSLEVIGYVDAIVPYGDGWAILDLKTSSMDDRSLASRLPRDLQLNLYAAFVEQIAAKYGLSPDDFKGALYNVAIKPKTTVKEGETLAAYAARAKPRNVEYFVDKKYLRPQDALEKMLAAQKVLQDRFSRILDEDIPCNFSNCIQYFSPCAYFSQCHGYLYGESVIEKREA